jgi:Derlin-2/3
LVWCGFDAVAPFPQSPSRFDNILFLVLIESLLLLLLSLLLLFKCIDYQKKESSECLWDNLFEASGTLADPKIGSTLCQ